MVTSKRSVLSVKPFEQLLVGLAFTRMGLAFRELKMQRFY